MSEEKQEKRGISLFTEQIILLFCFIWIVIGIRLIYMYFSVQNHVNSIFGY